MRIATRLKLAAWVPAFMALVIGLALLLSNETMEDSLKEGKTARQIMRGMNELNNFVRSYMLYREDRPKLQFLMGHDSVTGLTAAIRFETIEKQQILDSIRHNSESMRDAFLKLVSNYESPGSVVNAALLKEAEERLAGRVLTKARDVISDALRLESEIHEEISTTQRRISVLVIFLIVTTTFPLTIALIGMMRSINASLAALRKGTEIIAAGNLNHRIAMAAQDEIGDVSRAFDLMTEQLRETTVSRDELSKEVEERKRAEEALRKAHDELDLRVRERTAELARANRELQDFVFIAAHDLQEPLRKIVTFGGILTKRFQDPLGEKGKAHLARMTREASRMSALLRSLLGYSRLFSLARPFKATDLTRVVENVVRDFELTIRDLGGKVEVGGLPTIEADPDQMGLLFTNLIQNALKYCRGTGNPRIRIRGEAAVETCRIVVQDNGIGFEQQYAEKIFTPFQRLHGRKSGYEGTGMGLAVCRKIVELHGGEIRAEGSPGEGATFTVTLPIRQSQGGVTV
jgi:signal transduction histidine kinase